MRRLLSLFLVLLVAVSLSARPVYAAGGMVQVDGKLLLMDKGFLETDHGLFVPVGQVVKALGGTVAWQEDGGQVLLQANGRAILVTPGEVAVTVNGLPLSLSAPALVVEGELYLPASFLVMQFSPRLQIDHRALKDSRAMALLGRALQSMPANHDSQTEMQVVVEEPGMLWMNFLAGGMSQVRGEDSLSAISLMGPMGMNEVQEFALKDGTTWQPDHEGTWKQAKGGPGLLGESMFPVPAPVPVTGADLGPELLSALMLEAWLGEQRTEGNTTLQDVHLTLNFGPLLAAIAGGQAGAQRGPDGQPVAAASMMPEMVVERANMTLTIDLATGRLVSRQLDMALFMLMPRDAESSLAMRLQLYMKETITPNASPIAWPEGIK